MKVVIDDMTNRELDWLSEIEVFFETLENSNAENG